MRTVHLLAAILIAGTPVAAAPSAPQLPQTLDECEALARRDPTDLRCFALIAGRTQQWDEAISRLDAILRQNPSLGRGWWSLAYIEAARGKPEAIEHYTKAADALENAGVPGEAALVLGDLSVALMARGRLDDVDAALRRAEDLARRSGSEAIVAKLRTDRAWLAFNRRDLDTAEAILLEVQPTVFAKCAVNVQDRWLSGMGALCWATGRYQEALSWYQREADLLSRTGNNWDRAGVQYNSALIASRLNLGDEEVLRQMRDARDTAVASGNRLVEAESLLGLTSSETNALPARRAYKRAMELSEQLGQIDVSLQARRFLAESYMKQDPRDEARGRQLLDEAIAMARERGDDANLARGLQLAAYLAWLKVIEKPEDAALRPAAITASLEGLDAVEKIRAHQEAPLVRARVGGEWAYGYGWLAALTLATRPAGQEGRNDLELATQVMERLRSRTLLEEMISGRADGADPERVKLLSDIGAAQAKLLTGSLAGDERQALLADLSRLEAREAALRTLPSAPGPATAPVSLDAVEHALSDDEAILSFLTAELEKQRWDKARGSPEAWLLVHTRHGTTAYPLPDVMQLRAAVRVLTGLIEARDGSEPAAAASLHRMLLGAALSDLPQGVGKLVIVPDGVLHRLPFETLRAEPSAEPLCARFDITVAPSIAAWLLWKSRAASGIPPAALVLADPRIAPAPAPAGTTEGPARLRSWSMEMGATLGPLPHAAAESRSILRHVGGESRALQGAAASETALKAAPLGRFGLIHFAAHGLVDDLRPQRSGVLLTPGSDQEDGLLQSREIVNLDLTGRVVVLSACRSASGTLVKGEGILGLARSFFIAGARTVVGSLWPLRDADAADLFDAFYRHLGEGASVAAAMSAARRDLIRSGAPAAAWAGVIVMGDGGAVPLPGGRPFHLAGWHMGAAALLVTACFAFNRALPRKENARSRS